MPRTSHKTAFAWAINLAGLSGGLLTAPDKALAAFLRGRRSTSLYGQNLELLLERPFEDVRAECVFNQGDTGAVPLDLALFALYSLAALPVGIGVLLGGLMLTPLAVIAQPVNRSHFT